MYFCRVRHRRTCPQRHFLASAVAHLGRLVHMNVFFHFHSPHGLTRPHGHLFSDIYPVSLIVHRHLLASARVQWCFSLLRYSFYFLHFFILEPWNFWFGLLRLSMKSLVSALFKLSRTVWLIVLTAVAVISAIISLFCLSVHVNNLGNWNFCRCVLCQNREWSDCQMQHALLSDAWRMKRPENNFQWTVGNLIRFWWLTYQF